jgi:hypothetical protein
MALALATARFYCMNVGHRSEALTGPHSCGRGPGVGWRNITISLTHQRSKREIAGRATCVERYYSSDGAVVKIRVQVAADAPSAERNRLLNFNYSLHLEDRRLQERERTATNR